MTRSYEKEMQEASTDKLSLTKKIDFSMMKYLWLANPLSGARKDSIPRFLRNVELLKSFSDNELRLLAQYMHSRKFSTFLTAGTAQPNARVYKKCPQRTLPNIPMKQIIL